MSNSTKKQIPMVQSDRQTAQPPTAAGILELLGAGATMAGPITLEGRKPLLLVPDGYTTLPIEREDIAPVPDHIRGTVNLDDLKSFTDYVNEFKGPSSHIFAKASDTGATFTAILDYHQGLAEQGPPPGAGRLVHTAVYACPPSLEWKTWLGKNGVGMKQEEFVDFIDANARDVTAPDSASLLELAMNFESKTEANFQSKIRRGGTGVKVLNFTETTEAGRAGTTGEMQVPDTLSLLIPVFDGGRAFPLEARVDWDPKGGRLTITYKLRRHSDVVRAAVAEMRAEIATNTNITPLSGSVIK